MPQRLQPAIRAALVDWSPGQTEPPATPYESPRGFDLTTTLGVQKALNFLAAPRGGAQLVEDGVSGPKTRAAISAFQTAKGLKADGVVGLFTRAALATALGIV